MNILFIRRLFYLLLTALGGHYIYITFIQYLFKSLDSSNIYFRLGKTYISNKNTDILCTTYIPIIIQIIDYLK